MALHSSTLLVSNIVLLAHLDSQLTREGVDDINLVRVAMVNSVRRKVAFEMLVGHAERVLTDAPLHALIRQSIRCHGAKGTGLLITQADVRNC
jgi:hypothetical protein